MQFYKLNGSDFVCGGILGEANPGGGPVRLMQ